MVSRPLAQFEGRLMRLEPLKIPLLNGSYLCQATILPGLLRIMTSHNGTPINQPAERDRIPLYRCTVTSSWLSGHVSPLRGADSTSAAFRVFTVDGMWLKHLETHWLNTSKYRTLDCCGMAVHRCGLQSQLLRLVDKTSAELTFQQSHRCTSTVGQLRDFQV